MKMSNKEVLTNATTIIGYAEEVLSMTNPLDLLAALKCAASCIESVINVKMQEDIVKSIKERNNPPIVNNYPIKYRNGDN